jgi:two-component system response regulator YesN
MAIDSVFQWWAGLLAQSRGSLGGTSGMMEEARMDERRHVLIVDDDERVLFVLSRALRTLENEYHVETAPSSEEALQKAKARRPDIVVTDIVMPGMDGVELTEVIKDLHPDTEVIWITAYGRHRLQPDGERLDVHQCLEKPIGIAEIRQAVADAAEHGEG